MLYATIIRLLLYLLIIATLAVSTIPLMGIAGSYLKRKQDQLPKGSASQV